MSIRQYKITHKACEGIEVNLAVDTSIFTQGKATAFVEYWYSPRYNDKILDAVLIIAASCVRLASTHSARGISKVIADEEGMFKLTPENGVVLMSVDSIDMDKDNMEVADLQNLTALPGPSAYN